MTCTHDKTRDIATHGFVVAIGDPRRYNPAAHGGITVLVRCLLCGAEREENRNGKHQEYGFWGEPRLSPQFRKKQPSEAGSCT